MCVASVDSTSVRLHVNAPVGTRPLVACTERQHIGTHVNPAAKYTIAPWSVA